MDKDKEATKELIKKGWRNFWQMLLVLAVIHFSINSNSFAKNIPSELIIPILIVSNIVIALGTGILIGYYAYRFSHKKIYVLTGLLGFGWGLIVLPLLGAAIVQGLKNQALSKH